MRRRVNALTFGMIEREERGAWDLVWGAGFSLGRGICLGAEGGRGQERIAARVNVPTRGFVDVQPVHVGSRSISAATAALSAGECWEGCIWPTRPQMQQNQWMNTIRIKVHLV